MDQEDSKFNNLFYFNIYKNIFSTLKYEKTMKSKLLSKYVHSFRNHFNQEFKELRVFKTLINNLEHIDVKDQDHPDLQNVA